MDGSDPRLIIDGSVERVLEMSYEAFRAIAVGDQEPDVSRFHTKRRGDGVRFEALLRLAGVKPDANYVTLHATRDGFRVSVPLEPLRTEGVVVYSFEGRPLGVENFGPFRFLVKDPTSCRTGELDDCANVKYLDRIELTVKKGQDTRPTNDAEHEALHARDAERGRQE